MLVRIEMRGATLQLPICSVRLRFVRLTQTCYDVCYKYYNLLVYRLPRSSCTVHDCSHQIKRLTVSRFYLHSSSAWSYTQQATRNSCSICTR